MVIPALTGPLTGLIRPSEKLPLGSLALFSFTMMLSRVFNQVTKTQYQELSARCEPLLESRMARNLKEEPSLRPNLAPRRKPYISRNFVHTNPPSYNFSSRSLLVSFNGNHFQLTHLRNEWESLWHDGLRCLEQSPNLQYCISKPWGGFALRISRNNRACVVQSYTKNDLKEHGLRPLSRASFYSGCSNPLDSADSLHRFSLPRLTLDTFKLALSFFGSCILGNKKLCMMKGIRRRRSFLSFAM